ncbi:hypothetical protein YC2023_034785 [Brassica napus]
MDAMRKQLDVLMGANRNGDVTEVNRKYYDRDVCRLYLSGLCPHDLFQLTKRRQKVLEDAIDKAQGTHLVALDRHAPFKTQVECDRKIGRALKRLQEENAKAAIAISVTQVAQVISSKLQDAYALSLRIELATSCLNIPGAQVAVLLLEAFNKDRAALPTPAQQPSAALPPPNPRTQEMINEKLKKAEEFGKGLSSNLTSYLSMLETENVELQDLYVISGELGMVDEAQKALEEAEALKKGSLFCLVLGKLLKELGMLITDQKLRLCDICGAFLSIYDSDRRLADHFGGKLHLGYMLIRDKLAELQERSRERESSKERDRGDSRDRGRDIDRRNRDRDRHHEHDRNYNQSRGYDSRSRRSSRSRSRERPRDYDRRR